MKTYKEFREEKKFDYDDIKIAICIQEFYDTHSKDIEDEQDFQDYEDIITLVEEIKNNWLIDNSNSVLSQEEYAYIQNYAHKYLKEKYLD